MGCEMLITCTDTCNNRNCVFIIAMVFLIESIKKYLKQGNQKLNIATPITKYSIYWRGFLSGRGILYIKLNWIYEMQIITES
jgi:hypothetical protein